jgi:hypothetical protein
MNDLFSRCDVRLDNKSRFSRLSSAEAMPQRNTGLGKHVPL